MKKLKLEEILEGIEDVRRENSVQYTLYEVSFIKCFFHFFSMTK